MTHESGDPRRLRDDPGDPGSADERLMRQLRLLASAWRLPSIRVASPARPRSPVLRTLRLAAICSAILIVGGGASATGVLLVRRWQATPPVERAPRREPDAPRSPTGAAHHPARRPEPVPAPPVVAAAAAPVPPRTMRRVARAPEQSQLPPGITAETDLLRQALLAWRSGGDAPGALAVLDAYEARFPDGALAWEAKALRTRVLLRMGDRPGALAVLDRLPLAQTGVSPELIVTRGELRSLSGRCAEALADFDWVLEAAAPLASADRARALYGRASCRERMGDGPGAQHDRQSYLREFPDGPAVRQLQRQP